MPGRRKSRCPSWNASVIIRKKQPPVMLTMLFHTSPKVANGSSTLRSRCHQLKRYTVATSRRADGADRSACTKLNVMFQACAEKVIVAAASPEPIVLGGDSAQ